MRIWAGLRRSPTCGDRRRGAEPDPAGLRATPERGRLDLPRIARTSGRAALLAALAFLAPGTGGQDAGRTGDPSVEEIRDRLLERFDAALDRGREALGKAGVEAAEAAEATEALRAGLTRGTFEVFRGSLPKSTHPDRYGARRGEQRARRIEEGGFGSERALRDALDWLARHQSANGRWEPAGFSTRCKGTPCLGAGDEANDTGVTALAALAILGNGEGPGAGPYGQGLARALRWLLGRQDSSSGRIGSPSGERFMYGHAAATLALAETSALGGGTEEIQGALAKAVGFIHAARNRTGAWRYECPPNGESDSSVTGWVLLALRGAADAGIAVDAEDLDAGFSWLSRATDPRSGRCGYRTRGERSFRQLGAAPRFPADRTEALTALSLFARMVHGRIAAGDELLPRQAELFRKTLPRWEATPRASPVDEDYWFFGTLAAFQLGGRDWEEWNFALKKALLENQRRDGDAAGSWDPVGVWGGAGGRVAMTAFCAMCLEVYFRYGRTFGAR